MSEPQDSNANENGPISGEGARRKFLKKSGGIVVAAPAAVLLLSATSKNAMSQVLYGDATIHPDGNIVKSTIDAMTR